MARVFIKTNHVRTKPFWRSFEITLFGFTSIPLLFIILNSTIFFSKLAPRIFALQEHTLFPHFHILHCKGQRFHQKEKKLPLLLPCKSPQYAKGWQLLL